jgi:hypothetical protein
MIIPNSPSTQGYSENMRWAEAFVISARDCIWPGCTGGKAMTGTPICEGHALHVYDLIVQAKPAGELEARKDGLASAAAVAANTRAAKDGQSKAAQTAPGYVYYLRIGDRIKIGWTSNVWQRTKAYPPNAELLATHPGTRETEKLMHAKFAHLLVDGREWFQDHDSIKLHVMKVVDQYPKMQPAYRFQSKGAPKEAREVPVPSRAGRARRV